MNHKQYFRSASLLRYLVAAFAACILFFSSYAQENNLAIGQWRVHLPFNKINSVADGSGRVYCAANDGLFIYNKDDGNISRLTRLEGLSDFSIAHIRYSQTYHVLMVVYKNSNIDLIYDNNSIYNIPDIFRANIIGSKVINHIDFIGQYAYLSCGFGIVVVDLARREVKDTWYIGPGGNTMAVYGVVLYNNRMFAATEQGIFRAAANDPLIFLYSAWTKDTSLPDANKRYNHISLWGSKLVANCDSTVLENNLMVYDDTQWTYFNPSNHFPVLRLEYFNNVLVMANYFSVVAYDVNQNTVRYVDVGSYNNGAPVDGFVDGSNVYWLADANNGLVKSPSSGDYSFIYPNGPHSPNVYAMACRESRVWVASGSIIGSGFFNTYSKEGGYLFKDNTWKTFSKTTDDGLDTIGYTEFVAVAVDPGNADHAFFGSWGRGLFEFDTSGVKAVYAPSNSPVQGIPVPNYYHVQVGGVAFDSDRNLWMVNSAVSPPLLRKTPTGGWQSYAVPVLNNLIPQMLMCDSRNRKWIILPWTNGLVVFDELNTFSHTSDEVNDPHARKFFAATGKGKLPSVNVQSIAEDRDGQIWIGTEKGVAVLYSPDNIYSGNYDFAQVLLQQDGNFQYLLETEQVNAVAVDGANRKWFGTESGGAYLMSSDGTKQIQHFTTENSPLLSNKVQAITIDQKTGEVFFGTDKGIVSYKSDAIEGGEDFDSVYVYPNPVRPDYFGSIAIRGLVANANVKITDISGALVYETKSYGGQAIWNGTNFSGVRAQSGVYLVYCSNEDGSKTFITKLLFMH